MKFINLNPHLEYETKKHDHEYIPLEVPKGTCIMLHGHFIHRSFKNVSQKPRDAYAIHTVDNIDAWSSKNWLQRNDNFPQYWK